MKILSSLALPLLLAVLPATAAPSLHAQDAQLEFPAASPKSLVSEQVGLASVEIEYSRPSVKGRKIFGALVPYGEVWRTGANNATKLTLGADIQFGGESVPAGTYGLFTIPGENEWTVILSKVPGQWGSYAYNAKDDLVRVKAKPVALTEAVESFTIGIGDLRTGAGTAQLTLAWDKTRIAIPLKNDLVKALVPQIEAAMAGTGKKPYFEAAMFYYEHNLDLKKALAWMDEALKAQPDAMWMVYRKGLILAKAGDKPAALTAAKQALELATKAGGELGGEYKRLCETLIASLK
jgi:tetratricopeptide (TPR) repeat protein